jgi:hypothetical protein
MARIFDRQGRLRPSQLVTVAERRFEDARALCETGKNAHANGAQYLCGFVVEMLLKAQLMRKYPEIAAKRPHEGMSDDERGIWSLIYRSHDLDEMLGRLHEVQRVLERHGRRTGRGYLRHLREICSTWTIYARYSPLTTNMSEARLMLNRVRELKEVLK